MRHKTVENVGQLINHENTNNSNKDEGIEVKIKTLVQRKKRKNEKMSKSSM